VLLDTLRNGACRSTRLCKWLRQVRETTRRLQTLGSLFRDDVWKVTVGQGPESRLAVEEMTRLQQTCIDASDALQEHLRQAHPRDED